MEEDMQSHMSDAPSVKSRAQEIMDQVMAEEEEKMSMSQSQKNSTHRSMQEPENGGDEDDEEEEEDSDEEGHNVFYKARELIVSPTTNSKLSTRVFSRFLNR